MPRPPNAGPTDTGSWAGPGWSTGPAARTTAPGARRLRSSGKCCTCGRSGGGGRHGRVGIPASTCHAILARAGVPGLAYLDRATGRPVRRYEHPNPGDLIHVDVKKLGTIPDGGGWRVVGRAQGNQNKQRTTRARRNCKPVIGYSFLHTALDDHSRLAYTEILPDERKETVVAFWQRAHAWFTAHGITVRRVITDNGSAYKSFLWRDTLTAAGITVKKTRPFRPQTNGKVERFHRTLTDEWAYAKAYPSEAARRAALPAWLHAYNHHRAHTTLGGKPPASRVPNLSGQNT